MSAASREWAFKVELSNVRVRNVKAAIAARGMGSFPDETNPSSRHPFSGSQRRPLMAETTRGRCTLSVLPDLLCVLRFAFDGKVQDFPLVPRPHHAKAHVDDSAWTERDTDLERGSAATPKRRSTRGGAQNTANARYEPQPSDEESEDVDVDDRTSHNPSGASSSPKVAEEALRELTIESDGSAFVYRIRSESPAQLVESLQRRYATLQVLLLAPPESAMPPKENNDGSDTTTVASRHHQSDAGLQNGKAAASGPLGSNTNSEEAVPLTSGGDATHRPRVDQGANGLATAPMASHTVKPSDCTVVAVLGSATASLYELLTAEGNPQNIYSFDLLDGCDAEKKPSHGGSSGAKMDPSSFRSATQDTRVFDEEADIASVHTSDYDEAEKNDGDGDGTEFLRLGEDDGSGDEPHSDEGRPRTGTLPRVTVVMTMHEVTTVQLSFSTLIASHITARIADSSRRGEYDHDAASPLYKLRYHLVSQPSSAGSSRRSSGGPTASAPSRRTPRRYPVTATDSPVRNRTHLSPIKQQYMRESESFLTGDRVATSAALESRPVRANEDGSVVFEASRDLPSLRVKVTREGLAAQSVFFSLLRIRGRSTDAAQDTCHKDSLLWQYEVPLSTLVGGAKRPHETYPFGVPAIADPVRNLGQSHLAPGAAKSHLQGLAKVDNIPSLVLSVTATGPLATTSGGPETARNGAVYSVSPPSASNVQPTVSSERQRAGARVNEHGDVSAQELPGAQKPGDAPLTIQTTGLDGPLRASPGSFNSPQYSPAVPPSPLSPPRLNVNDAVSLQSISLLAGRMSPTAARFPRSPQEVERSKGSDRMSDEASRGEAFPLAVPSVLRETPTPSSGDETTRGGEEVDTTGGLSGNASVPGPPSTAPGTTSRTGPVGSFVTSSPSGATLQPTTPPPRDISTAQATTAPTVLQEAEKSANALSSRDHSNTHDRTAPTTSANRSETRSSRRSASQDPAAREATQAMRLQFTTSGATARTGRRFSPTLSPPPPISADRLTASMPGARTSEGRGAVLPRNSGGPQPSATVSSSVPQPESNAALAVPTGRLCPAWYNPSDPFVTQGQTEAERRKDSERVAMYRNLLDAYEAQSERARLAQEALERIDAELDDSNTKQSDDAVQHPGYPNASRWDPSLADTMGIDHDVQPEDDGGDTATRTLTRTRLAAKLEEREGALEKALAQAHKQLDDVRERIAENVESFKRAKRASHTDGQSVADGIAALTEVEADLQGLLSDAEAQWQQTLESKSRANDEADRVKAQLTERERTLALLEDQLRGSQRRHDEIRAMTSASGASTPGAAAARSRPLSRSGVPSSPDMHSVGAPVPPPDPRLVPSPPGDEAGRPHTSGGVATNPYVARRLSLAAVTTSSVVEGPAAGDGAATPHPPRPSDWKHFIASPAAGKPFENVSAHPYASARGPRNEWLSRSATVAPAKSASSNHTPSPQSSRYGANDTSHAQSAVADGMHTLAESVREPGWQRYLAPRAGPLSSENTPAWAAEQVRRQPAMTPPEERPIHNVTPHREVEQFVQRRGGPSSVAASSLPGEAEEERDIDVAVRDPSPPTTSLPPDTRFSGAEFRRPALSRHQSHSLLGGLPASAATAARHNASTSALTSVELEALLESVEHGDIEVAMHLLHTKPDLAQQSDSLLHIACAASSGASLPLVEMFLNLRPDLARDIDVLTGNTALHFACAAQRPSIPVIRALLLAGVPTDVRNLEGYTAFHVSVLNKADQMLHKVKDTLLALSARDNVHVNERTSRGQTPLHLVCGSDGNVSLVRYLLSRGADVWARAPFVNPFTGGRVREVTPMEQSREMGAMVVCQLIESAALNNHVGVYGRGGGD